MTERFFIAFGGRVRHLFVSDMRLCRTRWKADVDVLRAYQGDLRRKFADLPDSCEVLVLVNTSSVNPADKNAPGPFPQVIRTSCHKK